MTMSALLLTSIICFSSLSAGYEYIDESGLVKGTLAETIKTVDVDLAKYKETTDTLPVNHVSHAYAFLKGFSQADREFYRRGGIPEHTITFDQADKLLRLIRGPNALRVPLTPSVKKSADVVIFAGVEWSLKKRFYSFKKFLEEGFTCNNVYFLSINEKLDEWTKQAVEKHADLFKGINKHFILADSVPNQRSNMMAKIKPTMSQEFYLVSDPEYAMNLQESCQQYGSEQGLTFLGTFARTITTNVDEYIAMDLAGYKFDEFIKDEREQKRAAAYASLNLLAYQVQEEMLVWNQASKMTRGELLQQAVVEPVMPAIEPLVPQNIVTNLLQTYSNKEKELIGKDLKNITEMCFDDKTPVFETERLYVATAGGPGACKSTILETYLQDKSNLVYVDPDPRALKFMVNTYHQFLTYHKISQYVSYQNLLTDAYNKWRNASNYIANTILNEAYRNGYNIAHGTTATSPVMDQFFSKLKQRNYKIVLLLCYAPDETRIQALDHRAKNLAFIQASPEDVINKGRMFPERFPVYFKYADEIHIYWTQDFLKGSTLAATFTKEAGLVVHDKDAMGSFKAKYEADRKNQWPLFDSFIKA